MLIGRFGNTSGRPYMEARVSLPSTGKFADISFLFDTGADATLLMPMDSVRLGIDFSDPSLQSISLSGIGSSSGIMLPGFVTFAGDDSTLYVYQTALFIAVPSANNLDVPSLLGRNIIDRWHVNYAPSQNTLTAVVLGADHTISGGS